jgi:hypothetical protein
MGIGVLDRILDGDLRGQAVEDVRGYFTHFSGRYFESLDDGGDRPEVAERLRPIDLFAVPSLSISWRPMTTPFDILDRSTALNPLLADIPVVGITDPVAADLLADDGPVHELWRELRQIDGVGPTVAGKILARKRPALVPVFDTLVHEQVGSPDRFWLWWHAQLADERRVSATRTLRDEVGGIAYVSLLRVLDVAVWRHGKRQRG